MQSALIVSNGTPRVRCVCVYRARCCNLLFCVTRVFDFIHLVFIIKLLREDKYTFVMRNSRVCMRPIHAYVLFLEK